MTEVAEFNEVYEYKGLPYNQFRFVKERKEKLGSEKMYLSSKDFESSDVMLDINGELASDDLMSMVENIHHLSEQ